MLLYVVEIANAYEHDVMAMEPHEVYGDALDHIDDCPEGHLMIVDAEMEFIAYVPREKARVIEEMLNWAAENYPAKRGNP